MRGGEACEPYCPLLLLLLVVLLLVLLLVLLVLLVVELLLLLVLLPVLLLLLLVLLLVLLRVLLLTMLLLVLVPCGLTGRNCLAGLTSIAGPGSLTSLLRTVGGGREIEEGRGGVVPSAA